MISSEGEVDRSALAAVVFADDGSLRWLEDLVHPRVFAAWTDVFRSAGPGTRWAVEVPLLFETRLEDAFDAVVVITAPEDVRRARVQARGGQDFDARAALQWDEERKVALANAHYVNDGTEEALDAWVAAQVLTWAAYGET